MSETLVNGTSLLALPAVVFCLLGALRACGPALSSVRRIRTLNTIRAKLTGSRLRLITGIIFGAIFWIGLFFLFYDGFRFLDNYRLIGGPLLDLLFGLFFGSLVVLLLFSTGIILYASLFASSEAEFLLTRPVSADRIFAYKFQEALLFSCWGFFLLGSPMMLAYGLTADATLTFYPMAFAFFLVFALLPASLGAIACLLVANFLPRRKITLLATLATIVIGMSVYWSVRAWSLSRGMLMSRSWLNNLISQFQFANMPLIPSHWISKGLLAAARADGLGESATYLLILASHSLLAYVIASVGFAYLYRRGYDRAQSASTGRRKKSSSLLPAVVNAGFAWTPRSIRVLIVKDVQTFLRDPIQWSQALVLIGLLSLYFVGAGRSNPFPQSAVSKTLFSFLNLAITGLLLSTFTSRFIFPQQSLEGQKIWILGLCPIPRSTILWGKFAFAFGGSLAIIVPLTIVGACLLKLDATLFFLQLVTVTLLCAGLSGIAVGLGARFPDLQETDPSKIAAGFGGTLNLVTSLVFITLVVSLMAIPCHLHQLGQPNERIDTPSVSQPLTADSPVGQTLPPAPAPTLGEFALAPAQAWLWGSLSVVVAGLIGVGATVVPMRIGIRAFEQMEF